MSNLLLLYDLKEKDLARDIKDLLEEFNIGSITMISSSPNRGFTLEAKEKNYFDLANGAIFLLTPGSEKLGAFFPSPSVIHEMGQAKHKFQRKPDCVIYLVDSNCNMPAIEQKAYIEFDRSDIRSIISVLTQMVKDLKDAGLFRTTPMPPQSKQQPTKIDLESYSKKLNVQIKKVLFDISNKPNGSIENKDLTSLLKQKYNLSIQDINFLKRDLVSNGVVLNRITSKGFYYNFWFLTELGWDIVRVEIESKKKAESRSMNLFAEILKAQIKNGKNRK